MAIFTGALTTFGITVLVGLAGIGVLFARAPPIEENPNCDGGFCDMTRSDEVILVLIILFVLAVPIAVIGGFISALASLVLVRRKKSAQLRH